MKKISTITTLGILILLIASPYIAIARAWKDSLLMLAGLLVIIFSILLRKELRRVIKIVHEAHEQKSDTYVENKPQ